MGIGGRAKKLAIAAGTAALLTAALGSSSAEAASVSKNGSTLTYTAATGETNHLVASLASGTYTFDDSGATLTPGSGCTRVNVNRATCAATGVTAIGIDAGNMNDLAWVTAATPATITGGAGNDSLLSGNADDILIGCEGDDSMFGGGGHDLLFDNFFNCPGGGNDSLDGGTGPDQMFGGPGTDTVTYSGRTASVYVGIDADANDGEAGEGDQVSTDVENVTGGSGDDNITGGPGPNTLRGGAGNDVLLGERTVDLDGSGGNDSIFGEAGSDALGGGDGDNLLVGGDGNDTIEGGLGADSFDGGTGNDDLQAVDGVVDGLNCGAGSDTGVADPDDVVNPSCEAVDQTGFSEDLPPDFGDEGLGQCGTDFPFAASDPNEGISAGGGSESGGTDPGLADCSGGGGDVCSDLRISHRPVTLAAGEVGIRLTLPDLGFTRACKGRLKLTLPEKQRKAGGGRLKLGGEQFSLRPGQSKRFDVEISRAGRRMVRRADHLRIRVAAFARQDGELTKVASAAVQVEERGSGPNAPTVAR